MATKTFTFPASQVYVDSSGVSHTITTAQTFKMDMTDLGTTATYTGLADSSAVACTDGYTFNIHADPLYGFLVSADNTATDEEGCIAVIEQDGQMRILDVVSATVDDADVPTDVDLTLEHRADPSKTFTWTTLTVA